MAAFDIRDTDRYIDFELYLDGKQVITHDHLEDFEFSFGLGGDWKASITLFDHEWDGLQKIASDLLTFGGSIRFKFGWGGQDNVAYETTLIRWTPEFEHHGITLTLETGNPIAVAMSTRTAKGSWKKNTRPSDIARQLALEMGFKDSAGPGGMVIEESARYPEEVILDNKPPLVWITEQFCNINSKKPVRSQKSSDQVGYLFNIDRRGRFHFHTRGFTLPGEKNEVRKYIFAKDKNAQIISFAPTDNTKMWMAYGGSSSKVESVDILKKKPVVSIANTKTEKVESVSGNKITHDPSPNQVKRSLKEVHLNPEVAKDKAKERVSHAAGLFFQATLELMGDPTLDLNEFVNVSVFIGDTQDFYHLSGRYQILGVSHKISMADFTTTLTLARSANFEGPEEIATKSAQIKDTSNEVSEVGEKRGARSIA